jgi:hypothetical protein
VRPISVEACSLCGAAESGVLRPARHTPVCLRGRVLPTSSRPASVRSPGLRPATDLGRVGISGRVRLGTDASSLAPALSARLAAVLRRQSARDPAPRGTSALSLARLPPNPPRLRHAETLSLTSPHPFQGSPVFLEVRKPKGEIFVKLSKVQPFRACAPCRAERGGRTRFGGFAAKTVRDNEACSQARPSRAEIRG